MEPHGRYVPDPGGRRRDPGYGMQREAQRSPEHPGYCPARAFTVQVLAQRLVNMEGYMPGREVVILRSGDIGLIILQDV